jgi:hypothetical protein
MFANDCVLGCRREQPTQHVVFLDDFRTEIPLSCALEELLFSDHIAIQLMRAPVEPLRR